MFKKMWMALIGCLITFSSFAQQSWQLSANQDGIKVYSRQVPNSKFKALKVECELNTTLTQLTALLLDVDACKDWVYHTKSCTLLKRVSPSELYYYSEVSVPWPAENRDFVAHVMISQNPETKVVTMDAPCVQGMVPVKSGDVRIERSTGRWTITPAGRNKVKINYELQVDPGGDIPAWLTNMFATQGPLQSFKSLRQQVQKPAYRNAKLEFIKEG